MTALRRAQGPEVVEVVEPVETPMWNYCLGTALRRAQGPEVVELVETPIQKDCFRSALRCCYWSALRCFDYAQQPQAQGP